MKAKSILGAAMALGFVLSAPLMAADYNIDKKGQHAFVNFKASHLGYSYIIGRFNDFDGKFSHDKANPAASNVSVTINTKSLDTNHAERDKHLRSSDFFDADKYPTITFNSTSFDGKTLKGDLNLHGVTKNISIDVKHIGEGDDPWGGYRSGFEGSVTLKASDYGMPEWVGDIEVELNIEGVRQ